MSDQSGGISFQEEGYQVLLRGFGRKKIRLVNSIDFQYGKWQSIKNEILLPDNLTSMCKCKRISSLSEGQKQVQKQYIYTYL